MGFMNKKITGRNFKYESFLADIDKEMNKISRERRVIAAKHVKKKLKEKTSQKFGAASNITKGIGYKNLKRSTIVGVGPPAQAAHLIEFGTDKRYHLTGKRKGRFTGKIKADPFVVPVYREEAEAVLKILSEEWF